MFGSANDNVNAKEMDTSATGMQALVTCFVWLSSRMPKLFPWSVTH